jgi:hypothetical protein
VGPEQHRGSRPEGWQPHWETESKRMTSPVPDVEQVLGEPGNASGVKTKVRGSRRGRLSLAYASNSTTAVNRDGDDYELGLGCLLARVVAAAPVRLTVSLCGGAGWTRRCLPESRPALHPAPVGSTFRKSVLTFSFSYGLPSMSCSAQSRKPYTMTKQRERWTDDEHERFVEALRIHGRSWRKIEGA